MRRRRIRLLVLAVAATVLALVFWPDRELAVALAAYESLHPGMTFEQAAAAIPGVTPSPPAGTEFWRDWHFGTRYHLTAAFANGDGPVADKMVMRHTVVWHDWTGWVAFVLGHGVPRRYERIRPTDGEMERRPVQGIKLGLK